MGEPGRRRRLLLALAGAAAACLAALVVVLATGGRSAPRPTASHTAPPPSTPTTVTTTSTSTTPTAQVPGLPPPAGPPAQPPPSGEQYGTSVNRLFNAREYSPEQIGSQLRVLRATGAGLARSDALWEATEPQPPVGGVHHYDWPFDDAVATLLAGAGLRWLPILDYTAPWAQSIPGVDHSPPRSARDYAAYAGAFAARYGPGGTFWSLHPDLPAEPVQVFEIWNEPDNPTFWQREPDAGRYAELYLTARDAITSVDPGARVIVGGLTNAPSFLPAMLAARPDLRGHIDGVGLHPYGPDPLSVLAHVRAARQTLRSLGLGSIPLYITEFGWTTRPPGALHYAPEKRRRGFITLATAILGHTACGVAATLLYTWLTPERDPADPEDWFGISRPGRPGGPDVDAFRAGVRGAARAGRAIGC
jgi:hypothetical protein